MSSSARFKEGQQLGMQLFRPPDVRNGPAAAAAAATVASLRGPPGAGLLFASAQMRGGFPVDYGPRVDSPRSSTPMSSRSQQRPFSPKSSDGGNGSEETPPSRHLWVGNVSSEVTESLLMERFSKFGPVERVAVYSQRNYAFVNFRNLDSAKDAKAALQGVTVGGLSIRIEFAKGAKQSRHLWVGGICQTVTREQIEGEFKTLGVLEDFKFLRDRNCAFVDFVNIDDAIAAVDTLNGKRLGDEDLRVDFGRSMPPKRDVGGRPGTAADDLGDAKFGHDRSDQGRSATDSYDSRQSQRASGDSFRGSSDGTQATGGQGSTNGSNSGRSRSEKEEPSDVLWVGFPLLSKVDETGLRRAFMPYGEVERVKTFPGRTYAFVQFKNVEEATRARNALNGKLFNDPRVHIRFSNSEIGPVETPRSAPLNSPSRGRDVQSYSEKPALSRSTTGDRFQSMISPLHPTGLRPEYYPGGLARGAALARVAGNLPSLQVGRNVGRSLSGASDERITPGLGGIRNERNLPVPASGLSGRSSYRDQWELDDEMIGQEPKRLRTFHGGLDSANEGGRWYPEAGRYSPALNPASQDLGPATPVWNTVGGSADDLGKRSALQKIRNSSNQFDVLPALKANTPSLSALGSGAMGMANHLGKRDHLGANIGVTGVNEGWRWHGTIAKGGTPVCRAQCLPVGKGIDVTVPDVVNCTARTDLDMLAKHVHQAGDFGVVFFVPESDPDVPPYRDFMHYLGEKHRAGVAKLADGTTLFLVPPSEFSERVLKVPGNNCLFGVVLKSQPSGPVGNLQLQQQQQPSPHTSLQQSQAPPPLGRPQLQIPQQISQSHGSGFGSGSGAQDNGTIQAPNGTLTASQLSSLANGLPGGLTPDLLVSLSALLPRQNQSAGFPPPPLSISGSSASPSGSRDIGGTSQLSIRGPNVASPVPPSGDSKATFRTLQNTQQPPLQSQGWSSAHVDQQHLVGGPMSSSSEQRSAYGQTSLLPPGPPQSPHVPSMQQHQLSGPIQPLNLGGQGPELSGAGYSGQTFSQHPRTHPSATTQLGNAPVLPSDQLSQLTALLTQRQQQPAQQQQVAQLLHQHYQQQQSQQHPQESAAYPPSQGLGHSQQTQPPQYNPQSPAQQQWAQGGPNLQPTSSLLAISQARGPALQQQSPLLTSSHAPMPPGGGNSVWDMGLVSTVPQQQQQGIRPGQVPSPTPPPIQLPMTQNQLQPQVPPGDVGVDQGGSAGQDDGERQKRFQATLQLAAALLQQMQNQQQNPKQGTADQR